MESTTLTDFDLYLIAEGTHNRAYDRMGAHMVEHGGRSGVEFAVWAPNAELVSVIGDFNGWNPDTHPMRVRPEAGVWETFVPDIGQGARYKYRVQSRYGRFVADKADPYGFDAEVRPQTASRVWNLEGYTWNDHAWMTERVKRNALDAPISIYEVHLGSPTGNLRLY
jgi:1,4-alpha-glucan branching enzyme